MCSVIFAKNKVISELFLEICTWSKSTIETLKELKYIQSEQQRYKDVLVSLFLTFNICHTFF